MLMPEAAAANPDDPDWAVHLQFHHRTEAVWKDTCPLLDRLHRGATPMTNTDHEKVLIETLNNAGQTVRMRVERWVADSLVGAARRGDLVSAKIIED